MIWILLGTIHAFCVIGNLIYSFKENSLKEKLIVRTDGVLYALIPVISQGLLIYRILYR